MAIDPDIVPAARHPGGRPTEYEPEFADRAKAMCMRGATDLDLANEFGVTTVTIWRWQSRYEEFCNALKVGKDYYDDRVERSLAQRAVGYSFHSEKVFHNQGEIVRADIVEHVPPDVGAAKLWLTNRRGDRWRETSRQEISGPGGGPIEVTDISKLELARWMAHLLTTAQAPKALTSEDAE